MSKAAVRAGDIDNPILLMLRAHLLAAPGTITADEIRRSHALLALGLHFKQRKCAFLTSCKQMIVFDQKFSGQERAPNRCRIPNMQILATKGCECAGPRLEPTEPIANLLRGPLKINPPILFLENRRERCLRVILRTRRDCICIEPAQSVDHKIGTNCGQRGSNSLGSIRRFDRNFFLQQDVAGIESRVDSHGSDPSYTLSISDRPLNGRCSTIL